MVSGFTQARTQPKKEEKVLLLLSLLLLLLLLASKPSSFCQKSSDFVLIVQPFQWVRFTYPSRRLSFYIASSTVLRLDSECPHLFISSFIYSTRAKESKRYKKNSACSNQGYSKTLGGAVSFFGHFSSDPNAERFWSRKTFFCPFLKKKGTVLCQDHYWVKSLLSHFWARYLARSSGSLEGTHQSSASRFSL